MKNNIKKGFLNTQSFPKSILLVTIILIIALSIRSKLEESKNDNVQEVRHATVVDVVAK